MQHQDPALGRGFFPRGWEGSPTPALPGTGCGVLPLCRMKQLSACKTNPDMKHYQQTVEAEQE